MTRPAPRSLLLLTIDAWRADYCDTFAGVTLTPNLARHARHTVRFDRVWSNGPWTTPGLLPMFTGEGPARHGVHWAWSEPRADTPALAKVFAAAGHEVPNLCYLSQVGNYFHLGWDASTAPPYPHNPDDPVLFDFLRGAAAGPRRRPYFGWYHYKFVHLPYWPAELHRAALGLKDADVPDRLRNSVCSEFVLPRAQYPMEPGDTEIIRRLYAAGVHQADAFLGRVFDELERLGLLEDTTVVITSDHGEELMERGHAGHASTAEHALLNEELLRIPLIVVDSRVQSPGRRAERVEGVDLFPTLLGLAGLEAPPSQGVDVSALVLAPERFEPPTGFATRPFLFHTARMGYRTPAELGDHVMVGLSDGREKVIVERYEGERVSLYDLERDPVEVSPRSEGPEGEAAVARLDAAFESGWRGVQRVGGSFMTRPVTAALACLMALALGCEPVPTSRASDAPDGAVTDASPPGPDLGPDANMTDRGLALPWDSGPRPDPSPARDGSERDAAATLDASPENDALVLEAPELPQLDGVGAPGCRLPPVVPAPPSFPADLPFAPHWCPDWGEGPDSAPVVDVTLDLGMAATGGHAIRAGGRTFVIWWSDGADGHFGVLDAAGPGFAARGVLQGLNRYPGRPVEGRIARTCDGFVALTLSGDAPEDGRLVRIDRDGREVGSRSIIEASEERGYVAFDSSVATVDEGIVVLLAKADEFEEGQQLLILNPETLSDAEESWGTPIVEAVTLAAGRLDGTTHLYLGGSPGDLFRPGLWLLPLDTGGAPAPDAPNAPDPGAMAAAFASDGLYSISFWNEDLLFTHLGPSGALVQRRLSAEGLEASDGALRVVATGTGAVVVVSDPSGGHRALDLDAAGIRRGPDGWLNVRARDSIAIFATPNQTAAAHFHGEQVRVAPMATLFAGLGDGSTCTLPEAGECGVGQFMASNAPGDLVCVTPDPAAETCNGRDDDCDGGADEGLAECPTPFSGPRVGPPPPKTCPLFPDFPWPPEDWSESPVLDPCAQVAADAPCAAGDLDALQPIVRDADGRVLVQNGVSYRWDPQDGTFQGREDMPAERWEYDDTSRLTAIRDDEEAPAMSFEYDAQGRLTFWWRRGWNGRAGRETSYQWSDDGTELIVEPLEFGESTQFVCRFRLENGRIIQGECVDRAQALARISFGFQAVPGAECQTIVSYEAYDDGRLDHLRVSSVDTVETDHAGRVLRIDGMWHEEPVTSCCGDDSRHGWEDVRFSYDARGRLVYVNGYEGPGRFIYDCEPEP